MILKNINLTLLVCVFALSCSCNGQEDKTLFDQNSCENMQDMKNALPRLTTYKGYKLRKVACDSEGRHYMMEYSVENDTLSTLAIILVDARVHKDVWIEDTKNAFDLAQRSYEYYHKSNAIGNYCTIYISSPSVHMKSYSNFCELKSVLKNNYVLNITVRENKLLRDPVIVKEFVSEFISEIDTSVLK